MLRKTIIKLAGISYVAELQEEFIQGRGIVGPGLFFRIMSNEGEILGCLSAFISLSAKTLWENNESWRDDLAEDIFIRIIPHIRFEISIEDFERIYPECIQIMIQTRNSHYDQMTQTQYVKSMDYPELLVKHLVFHGEIDDEQVQKEVLSYLYEKHIEDQNCYLQTNQMAKELFINERTVYRCLGYLNDDGFVTGHQLSGTPGITYLQITTDGVRHVRRNFQQVRGGAEVIIMGDYVGKDKITTNVTGDSNQTAVASTINNSFNVSRAIEKANELKKVIEAEYIGEEKDVLLREVDEIKNLAQDKDNFAEIRRKIGEIVTKTADVAKIVGVALQLAALFAGGS